MNQLRKEEKLFVKNLVVYLLRMKSAQNYLCSTLVIKIHANMNTNMIGVRMKKFLALFGSQSKFSSSGANLVIWICELEMIKK